MSSCVGARACPGVTRASLRSSCVVGLYRQRGAKRRYCAGFDATAAAAASLHAARRRRRASRRCDTAQPPLPRAQSQPKCRNPFRDDAADDPAHRERRPRHRTTSMRTTSPPPSKVRVPLGKQSAAAARDDAGGASALEGPPVPLPPLTRLSNAPNIARRRRTRRRRQTDLAELPARRTRRRAQCVRASSPG